MNYAFKENLALNFPQDPFSNLCKKMCNLLTTTFVYIYLIYVMRNNK